MHQKQPPANTAVFASSAVPPPAPSSSVIQAASRSFVVRANILINLQADNLSTRLALAGQRQAVADRDHADGDAFIGRELSIERPQGDRIGALVLWVNDAAAP